MVMKRLYGVILSGSFFFTIMVVFEVSSTGIYDSDNLVRLIIVSLLVGSSIIFGMPLVMKYFGSGKNDKQ